MMKNRILILAMLLLLPTLAQAQKKYAVIEFDTTVYNFGTVEEGPYITCEFRFTNTGDADLVIKNYHKECGCTSVEFPKEAIKPGESGVIKVTYETQGRPGSFSRGIILYTNASISPSRIFIKGVVIKAAQ